METWRAQGQILIWLYMTFIRRIGTWFWLGLRLVNKWCVRRLKVKYLFRIFPPCNPPVYHRGKPGLLLPRQPGGMIKSGARQQRIMNIRSFIPAMIHPRHVKKNPRIMNWNNNPRLSSCLWLDWLHQNVSLLFTILVIYELWIYELNKGFIDIACSLAIKL